MHRVSYGERMWSFHTLAPNLHMFTNPEAPLTLSFWSYWILHCYFSLVAKSGLTLQPHRLKLARLLCPWGFPARILEWDAISSSRGSSLPRGQTHVSYVSCIGRWVLYHWATWEAHTPAWLYHLSLFTREGGTVSEVLAYCVPPLPGKVIKLLFLLHNCVSIFLFVTGAQRGKILATPL